LVKKYDWARMADKIMLKIMTIKTLIPFILTNL